jgi:hypothetical protein
MWEGCADIGRDGGLAVTAFFSSLLRHLSRSNVNVAFSRDSVFFFVPRVFCTAGEMHQSRQPAVVVYRHWHFTVLLVVALVGDVSFLVSISFSNALSLVATVLIVDVSCSRHPTLASRPRTASIPHFRRIEAANSLMHTLHLHVCSVCSASPNRQEEETVRTI